MAKAARQRQLTIMVASSVYGFEDHLNQICVLLGGMGYRVWNSHLGTLPVNPNRSNLQNCLEAVRNCDIFLGVIRPFYGSGVIGATSITHEEMKLAVDLRKPRWFLSHRDVVFARQVFKQFMFNQDNTRNEAFVFRRTAVLDDLRVIDMYNDVTLANFPPEERVGHWAQEYYRFEDILTHLESQFREINRVVDIVNSMNQQ